MHLIPSLSMDRAPYVITFSTRLSEFNCRRHFDVIIVSLTTIINALFMFVNPVLCHYENIASVFI